MSFSPAWCRTVKRGAWASLTRSASACGTTSFRRRAPRLPPITSRRSAPSRAAKRTAGGARVAIFRAHRIADHAHARPARERGGKGREHFTRQRREAAIGETRDGILLMHQQRTTQQPCSETPGPVTKPPSPTTTAGRLSTHDAQCLPQRAQQVEWRGQQRKCALAAQTAHRQPLDRKTISGHHARFETTTRAEPDHFALLCAQQPRQCQRPETHARPCRPP